jgi:hypothetical protein
MIRMDTEELVSTWRQILCPPDPDPNLVGDEKSWVLFHHGTCVVLPKPDPVEDLGEQAVSLLAEYGPVHIGSSAGDFSVIELEDVPGWCVTCHHDDVLTYVEPADVTQGAGELEIGLCGRSKRHMDGTELTVAHVEDRRLA